MTFTLGEYGLKSWEVAACAIAGLAAGASGLWVLHPFAAIAAGFMLYSVLMIVLIDYRNFIIPDVFSLPAFPLGLAVVQFGPEPGVASLAEHAAAGVVAAAALYLIAACYRRVRGVEGLGLGDVKLAAVAGAWTGFDGLPVVILVASGAALSTVLLGNLIGRSERATLKTAVPFGSFLAPAILIVWCLQIFGPY